MNIQEFKIWFSGFNAAMGTNTPNVSQWGQLKKMVDELDSSKDAFKDIFKNNPLPPLQAVPPSQEISRQAQNPPSSVNGGIRKDKYPGSIPTDPFEDGRYILSIKSKLTEMGGWPTQHEN